MSTHIGKIGRLSKDRREELGRRIEDGHAGPELAEWLNGLPDVQAVLRGKFEGRPISEQNLSAWRLSGHVNWLRRQEARAGLAELIGDSNQMDDAVGDWSLGERLGTVLAKAAELNAVGMALLGGETDLAKRWERLRELHREVSRLRQDDDRARRAALQQERWDRELEKEGVTMEPVKRCKEESTEESKVQGPESKVGEACVEGAVNRDESRQNKVNQGTFQGQGPGTGDGEGRGIIGRGMKNEELRRKNGEGEARPAISVNSQNGNTGVEAKVQFLLEERLLCLDEPGCEILFTQDNTYGTRYRKVPIGWQDPEGLARGSPRSKIQSPKSGDWRRDAARTRRRGRLRYDFTAERAVCAGSGPGGGGV